MVGFGRRLDRGGYRFRRYARSNGCLFFLSHLACRICEGFLHVGKSDAWVGNRPCRTLDRVLASANGISTCRDDYSASLCACRLPVQNACNLSLQSSPTEAIGNRGTTASENVSRDAVNSNVCPFSYPRGALAAAWHGLGEV